MYFQNHTPFSGLGWLYIDANNQSYITTMCRVKFLFKKTETSGVWNLQVDPKQDELFFQDVPYDSGDDASVRYESDLVPFKQYADIIVNAKTYNLFHEKKWSCSVALQDKNGANLIHFPLSIRVREAGVSSVNIRYENSAGGVLSKNKDASGREIDVYDEYNPVGCGKNNPNPCEVQIDYQEEPITNIPAGFGCMHRAWKSRTDYAGTYDEKWKEEQSPLLPKDFDDSYYQAAHPKLIMDTYLKGGERLILTQLMKEQYQNTFVLPDFQFMSRVHTPTQVVPAKMNLDTVVVDIYDESEESYHVYMSWRSKTKIFDEPLGAEVMYIPREGET